MSPEAHRGSLKMAAGRGFFLVPPLSDYPARCPRGKLLDYIVVLEWVLDVVKDSGVVGLYVSGTASESFSVS